MLEHYRSEVAYECGTKSVDKQSIFNSESSDVRGEPPKTDKTRILVVLLLPSHLRQCTLFLVGMKGKDEAMAIGGHWSPSLDGANPEKDPSVLIKTAIRSCKALTGIDLSLCTQWYRFAEIRYHRPEETHKGRTVPAHVETVVLFLPDVWHCLPTRSEWETLSRGYKQQLSETLQAERKEADGEQALNANPFFLFPLLAGTGNTGTKCTPTHYTAKLYALGGT
ncbi:Cell division cycle and apoptosis regulator protein 1 [Acipenser ruthenus]|uniref:Cell division cycle and apoptosis regulator protein 1 n=1 Tax=Acipenser ruthenus TaxID=7906 RepID=A0A444U682_ACIRT|nr:Cell division cycle and apoptosis regulator protein 1 [Acipenser ruthenus]